MSKNMFLRQYYAGVLARKKHIRHIFIKINSRVLRVIVVKKVAVDLHIYIIALKLFFFFHSSTSITEWQKLQIYLPDYCVIALS